MITRAAALVAVLSPSLALVMAEDLSSPYVAGFESRAPSMTDRSAGLLLIEELNCISCHRADEKDFPKKSAPSLRDVAQRDDPHFIQQYLLHPNKLQPRSTMPALLAHLSNDQQQEQAEALTHYLVSISRGGFAITPPDKAAVHRGEQLYHEVGCVACHAPLRDAAPVTLRQFSRLFPVMEEKYSRDGLRQFLRDPHAVRPAGRMPDMLLTDREADDIAEYLVRETKVAAPLNYDLLYGRRSSLDDEDELELNRTGTASGFNLGFPHRGGDFSVRLSGFLKVEDPGRYEFQLDVDDGGRLRIDDRMIIDNNSVRTTDKTISGKASVTLTAGLHAISVEYFQRRDESVLELLWTPPGRNQQKIPSNVLQNSEQIVPPRVPWEPDSEKAQTGKALFTTLGCNNCHPLQPEQAINNYPGFAQIQHGDLTAGCLSESSGPYPDFRLNEFQRTTIRAGLLELAKSGQEESTPLNRVAASMARLNCYACHSRGVFGQPDSEIGGVADDRRDYFATDVIELGDEGRLPPSLTGVGDKLQKTWLQSVLFRRGIARPYMKVRMPQFGEQHVAHLVDDFISLDRLKADVGEPIDAPAEAQSVGLSLVDQGRLQCIGCHDFNRHKSIGIRAMDLVTMPERLNRDWFHRYMMAPGKFRPGTKMPSAWPNGRSLFKDVLDGDAFRQVDAIWTYLADGRKAIPPAGLNRQSMEIIVGGEAVVYRNKIREAGFRGICVGYPEEVNLSFDADSMRLAQIWKGRFLNAAAHWSIQGMGRIGPIGHDVITLPHGPPLARLASDDTSWPEAVGKSAEYQFRGYQLDQRRRPRFEYTFGDVSVTDFCEGLPANELNNDGQNVLRRTLTFANHKDESNLWFRLWVGENVVEQNGALRCGEKLVIRVPDNVRVQQRDINGQTEILLGVSVVEQLVIEYSW